MDQAVPYAASGVAWQLRESARRTGSLAGFGFAFVAHGYLEPSRRVPGERERYPTSRRKCSTPHRTNFRPRNYQGV